MSFSRTESSPNPFVFFFEDFGSANTLLTIFENEKRKSTQPPITFTVENKLILKKNTMKFLFNLALFSMLGAAMANLADPLEVSGMKAGRIMRLKEPRAPYSHTNDSILYFSMNF